MVFNPTLPEHSVWVSVEQIFPPHGLEDKKKKDVTYIVSVVEYRNIGKPPSINQNIVEMQFRKPIAS